MTVLESAAANTSLWNAMREGSVAEHQDAESSAFVEALMGGRINEEGYAQYLGRLRKVYAALESVGRGLAESGDAITASVWDAKLERLDAIDADLAHWTGGEPLDIESPVADEYVARIEASTSWSGLYLAHHYTRYLGDLSGGQIIGLILKREFGLTDAGTSFYVFTEIPKVKPYKDGYRARMDELGMDTEDIARVVAEVKVAFNLNQALFSELGGLMDAWARTPAAG